MSQMSQQQTFCGQARVAGPKAEPSNVIESHFPAPPQSEVQDLLRSAACCLLIEPGIDPL
jgi:hypothetical protein